MLLARSAVRQQLDPPRCAVPVVPGTTRACARGGRPTAVRRTSLATRTLCLSGLRYGSGRWHPFATLRPSISICVRSLS